MVVRVAVLHDLKLPTSITPVKEVTTACSSSLIQFMPVSKTQSTSNDALPAPALANLFVATGPAISLLRQRGTCQASLRVPQLAPLSKFRSKHGVKGAGSPSRLAAGSARQHVLLSSRSYPVASGQKAGCLPGLERWKQESFQFTGPSFVRMRLSYAAYEARRHQLAKAYTRSRSPMSRAVFGI